MAPAKKNTTTPAVFDPMDGYEQEAPFRFIGIDGETYELPSMGEIPMGVILDSDTGDERDALLQIVGDSPAGDALRQLPARAAVRLFDEWQKHSQVAMGESTSSQS